MKTAYLLVLLLALAQLAAAQTFPIVLPPSTLAPGQLRVEKVVDARADRTMLGVVHQGLDNHLTPANFRQSLEAEVLAYAGPRPDAGQPAVVLRIRTLQIAEEIHPNSERATVEMTGDFLLHEGEQYYPLLPVGMSVETKGLDVTAQHAGNIAKVLADALFRLAELPATQRPAPDAAALTWEQVQRGEGYKPFVFPIQRTKEPRRGFYRTFQEFQNDSPSKDETPFEVVSKQRASKQWEGRLSYEAFYLKRSPTGQQMPVRGAWGMSDGSNVYIFQRGSYFRLTPVGSSYTFTGFAPADPNDLTTGAILGGLAGMAIVNAMATAPMDYEMSATTGTIHPVAATDGFTAATDTAAVYLYRRAEAGAAPVLQVLVDDKPAGLLGPNQYLALAWRDRRRDMKICVRGEQGAETCYTFLPVFGIASYLACTQAASATPVVQPVAAKVGAFNLKHLKLREPHP